MSQFYSNYQQEQAERAARQANNSNSSNFTKVGFFGVSNVNGTRVKYMTKSGDQAVVRINYGGDPNDLLGARLHAAGEGVTIQGRPFQKVLCLNPDNACPLCNAIAGGNKAFGKATTRVFIPMVIAYRLPDGTYTKPEPVVMDAAAYMVDVLANTMSDFGALREHVFKLTRSGVGTDTRYSLSYIPTLDNENIINKASLVAFNNFEASKHSYWIKSEEDMNTFLNTGTFPDVVLSTKNNTSNTAATNKEFKFPDDQTVPFNNNTYNNAAQFTSQAQAAPSQATAAPTQSTPNRQPAYQANNDTTKEFDFSSNW